MEIVAVIPARMGSSRFPGKPLALIHDIPMVGHVYLRTRLCPLLSETYVATCDQEIFDYVGSIGGQALMTADTHERCTDRTAEALSIIEARTGRKVNIVVMVQGDEPMVTPDMVTQAVSPMLDDPTIQVVNLMAAITTEEEFANPNIVKVVVDTAANALYFSREPIPSRKKASVAGPMNKQVCIIPFRRDYLLRFNALPPTPLEEVESVDMLRILEHGDQVHMVPTEEKTIGVDTPGDLALAVELMRGDPLMGRYAAL